jgi:ribonucleoside-diphosphate reductase alpha chain
MRVTKRSGDIVEVDFHEIKRRLWNLCDQRQRECLDVDTVVIQVINGMVDCISTSALDKLAAAVCVSMQSLHYLYDDLAGQILVSDQEKNCRSRLIAAGLDPPDHFSSRVAFLARSIHFLDARYLAFVESHRDELDALVKSTHFQVNYFAFKTLERAYLQRVGEEILECPKDMFMRVAVALHLGEEFEGRDSNEALVSVRETYQAMVERRMTHATPTLFNAGCTRPQLSSCFLLGTRDALSDIYKTLGDCAEISKWAGGIGLHVSNVRGKGSRIASTNGTADGLVPMLRVFNETARYCNQAGRRKGSICVYLEPWHCDVMDFVELRRNVGAETERTRDLFLALWVPDLFMECLEQGGEWYLMSPDECPGLNDVWGEEFRERYEGYVREGKFRRKIPARKLWSHILQCQMETGTPYILFKDNVNAKSNHSNVGVIRSSNLCAEITIYSDHEQYGVCNLASIAVNAFVDNESGEVNHQALHRTARLAARNLDRVIDLNYYPTPEARRSNQSLRPIGIGIQGFADLLCLKGVAYDSPEALRLSRELMETVYHGALTESVERAVQLGPYPMYAGSEMSKGRVQFHMWGKSPNQLSGRWDWEGLLLDLRLNGARNSLLTALMPTASTSQILGNQECFEPYTANIYKRTTLAGEFLVINRHLMRELMEAGLWTPSLRDELVRSDGSVQGLAGLSQDVRDRFKTVWEIQQSWVVEHALARAPFVDQSQSMNLFYASPEYQKLNKALLFAWKSGLKTGCYYLRSKPAREAYKVGLVDVQRGAASAQACARKDGGECLSCGA